MCWSCSKVRPDDGPAAFRVTDRYDYAVNGSFLMANRSADWESLASFPEWTQFDNEGEPFFLTASPEEAYRIARSAYLYGIRAVLRLPMSDCPGKTRQIAGRQFWEREAVAIERGWPADWLEKLIEEAFPPRHNTDR